MKVAYLQCTGGASGDMILGALLDSGLSFNSLEKELAKLHTSGFALKCESAVRGGVIGTHIILELDDEGRRKRNWSDFVEVVESSALSQGTKKRVKTVFERLREAEAQAHKSPVGDVHLHELGTLDTLIDVVGAVAGLEMLGVQQLYCSPLPVSTGIIKSEHGVLPALAPATLNLIAMAKAPLSPTLVEGIKTGEMVTPTGAAIVTTLGIFRQPSMTVESIGYGLGTRNPPDYPNVVCLWVGSEATHWSVVDTVLLETNIDDMSPQLFGYVQERLMGMGANDVWFTPIQMKKNRPGVVLSALVPLSLETAAVDLIIRETSTLGIRVRPVHRYVAQREMVDVETSLGKVRVKVKKWDGKTIGLSPEYEDCRRIALETKMSLQDVMVEVKRQAEEKVLSQS